MKLSSETVSILGDGLKKTKSLKTLSLRLGGFGENEEGVFELPTTFSKGLEENVTLETLELDGVPEDWSAVILEALTDHPTLQILNLKKCTWGDSTLKSLRSLLSSPECKLRLLDMSYPHLPPAKMNMELLAASIEASHSLQKLKLRKAGLDRVDLSKILISLEKCPSLVDIDMMHNHISSLDFYHRFTFQPTRLRRLNLDGNPITWQVDVTTKDDKSLIRFLENNAELGYLGERFEKYSSRIEHLLDMNRCGRVLFRNGNQNPLSVWPGVLTRANCMFQDKPKRQANVVYGLVHGLVPIWEEFQ
jgi:hypothetical protein